MRILFIICGWLAGLALVAARWTCRFRAVNDPRPGLKAAGRPYVYAILHAHQIAAVMICDDWPMAVMVSRSRDAEVLLPSLKLRRILPVRGSTNRRGLDKGGGPALLRLIEAVRGGATAVLAVDGPRGPRNTVHRGIAALARRAEAVIVPCVVSCRGRLILTGTWDRMQVPLPFARIALNFCEPLTLDPAESDEELRARVGSALAALERRYDPLERRRCYPDEAEEGRGGPR